MAHSSDEALAGLGRYSVQEAARPLGKAHPGAAARLWRALALGVLATGRAKSYPAALRDLERARDCYERAGLPRDWHRLVAEVRAEHHRKSSFLPAFEELVRGADHARSRRSWSGPRHGRPPR
ncbi:MAG TPA: hypothetical protein VM324_03180 [Egibacteraceae bacterium]|nr:hypothetical protein [Egibacteraceae bacterium]